MKKKYFLLGITCALLVFLVSGCSFIPIGLLSGIGEPGPDGIESGRGASAGASMSASPAGDSSTLPGIKNVRTCEELSGKQCAENGDVINADAAAISMSAVIENAVEGLEAQITWSYLGGEVDPFMVATTTVTAEKTEASRPLTSTVTKKSQDKLWASGEYKVEVKINGPGDATEWKTFKVR